MSPAIPNKFGLLTAAIRVALDPFVMRDPYTLDGNPDQVAGHVADHLMETAEISRFRPGSVVMYTDKGETHFWVRAQDTYWYSNTSKASDETVTNWLHDYSDIELIR